MKLNCRHIFLSNLRNNPSMRPVLYSDPIISSTISETHRVCVRSLVVVVDGGGGRRGSAERDPVLGLGGRQPPPAPVGVRRRRERHQSGRELPDADMKG